MRRFITFSLIVGLGFALAAPGFSQEKLVLTLEDCLNLALTQNPSLMATREREAAARAQVRQAASRFFPSLNGQGSDILDKKVFTIEFPSFIPGEPPQKVKVDFTKTYQFTMAFSMPLFAGGSLISGFRQANITSGRRRRSSASPSRRRSSTSRRPSTAISWPPSSPRSPTRR